MESSLVMTSDILEMDSTRKPCDYWWRVVGIELGQAFMTFGSKVTVIEMMDRIDSSADAEVSKTFSNVRYDNLDGYETQENH